MFKTSGFIGALLALVLMAPPANADTPMTEGWHKNRMADASICIQKSTPLKGWRLRKAIASWNNVGIVSISYSHRCDTTKPYINVVAAPSLDYRGQQVGGYANNFNMGDTAPDGTVLVTHSEIHLNNGMLAQGDRLGKKCWGWYVTAHEIGHSLGIGHTNDATSVMSYDFPYMDWCHQMQFTDHTLLAELGY